MLSTTKNNLRPCTHEQIKYPLFEQFLDRYEVNLLGFAQINCALFAHVYAAYACTHGANKSLLFAQILGPYEVALDEFAQLKDVLFAHVVPGLNNASRPGKVCLICKCFR